jgi:hypothetical protein
VQGEDFEGPKGTMIWNIRYFAEMNNLDYRTRSSEDENGTTLILAQFKSKDEPVYKSA